MNPNPKATIKDYAINLYWDERAGYFVAEIPEIATCAADGSTQLEALANLQETFAVLKEAYQEEGMKMPLPSPELPFSVTQLSALSDIVKVSRLAELAGIPGQTLATKLKRGTEFTVGESRRIADALSSLSDIIITYHHGTTLAETKHSSPEKHIKGDQRWSQAETTTLRKLARQNTPTRVIGLKMGRTESAVYQAASKQGIVLHPSNESSVRMRESSGSSRSRRK